MKRHVMDSSGGPQVCLSRGDFRRWRVVFGRSWGGIGNKGLTIPPFDCRGLEWIVNNFSVVNSFV